MNVQMISTYTDILVNVVLLGAVLWAYLIERRLGRIESKLSVGDDLKEHVRDLEVRLRALEIGHGRNS